MFLFNVIIFSLFYFNDRALVCTPTLSTEHCCQFVFLNCNFCTLYPTSPPNTQSQDHALDPLKMISVRTTEAQKVNSSSCSNVEHEATFTHSRER